MPVKTGMTLIKTAAQAAEEKLGKNITAIDVRGYSSVTDYFLFVGATSHVHVRALEDTIRNQLRESGVDIVGVDGRRGHAWRVLDYGSCLIHILEENLRDFYGIERLWNQGKEINLKKSPRSKRARKK